MVDEDNDPISKYCLGKLTDPLVHVAVMVLNDILSELAELCCVFQRSCITTIEAVQFAKAKINKLKAQYLGDTIHWGAEVAQLLSTYPDVDTAAVLRFIQRACNHLQDRFPDGELKEWIAFDTQAILAHSNFEFGNEELKKLIEKYQHFWINTSSTENETNDSAESIIFEYNEFKFVLVEKLKTGSSKTFTDVVGYAITEEKFSKLAKLIDICGMCQASSADAERGFSLMNNIKTKSRNRLEEEHLDMLMRIKFYMMNG